MASTTYGGSVWLLGWRVPALLAGMDRQGGQPRQTFPRAHRLSGRKAFAAVFDHKLRKNIGPLSVLGRPNGLDHLRLGLSVPRRVGTAVTRNRIKRLLREAYRLQRHELPKGYDVVVAVRPHATLELADYGRLLRSAVEMIDRESARRARRDADREGSGPSGG